MPTSAVLDDLIDALEEQSDSLFAFLDQHTGEVFLISEESLALTESDLDAKTRSVRRRGGLPRPTDRLEEPQRLPFGTLVPW